MKPLSALALAAPLTFAAMHAAPAHAADGPWAYGIGGGLAAPYTPISSEEFGPGWSWNTTVVRWLKPSLGLRGSANWIHHGRSPGISQIPENTPATLNQHSDYFPVALGLRWVPDHERRLFFDVSPSVVLSRWHQEFNQDLLHWESNLTSAQPGVELGIGAMLSHDPGFNPEISVHYLAATAPNVPTEWFGGRKLQSVSQWTVGLNMSWRP